MLFIETYVIHKNRIQNSFNLLIFLAAVGGWPPAANFTLAATGRALKLIHSRKL